MEELSGMKAEIGNDANVAALGEMWLGAGRAAKILLWSHLEPESAVELLLMVNHW